MYNFDFKVKYREIENELLAKIEGGETEYDKDDVELICDKLYRDELTSVLGLENNIDTVITELWQLMTINDSFMNLVNLYKTNLGYSNLLYSDFFALMFNFDLFHIVHKCICSQYPNKTMSDELLNELSLQIKQLDN